MNAYDEILYPSRTYAQTHPDRLATMATLTGLRAPEPSTARVLDIGCGDGLNLLAMAAEMPDARFHGIDLAEVPIKQGREWIEELGLGNVELEVGDIADPKEFGKFDYIIAHGVFSWVPEPVRHQILRLCREALAPNGVAYISYNAYPGCHMRELSRRMMTYHVSHLEDPKKRISQARSLLKTLVENNHDEDRAYHKILKEQFDHSLEYNEAAFYHDDLSTTNQPYYFHEFMQLAEGYDLQFMSEADFHSMFYGAPETAINQMLRKLGESDLIGKEQYLDFLSGRQFRQTLLCHADVPLDRRLTREKFDSLYLCANLSPVEPPEDAADGTVVYTGKDDAKITTRDEGRKKALEILCEAWPQAVPFSKLASECASSPEEEARLMAFVIRVAMSGMIQFRLTPVPLVSNPGPTPTASPFARWEARRTNAVTSLAHTRIKLENDSALALLELLDGTRTREQLARDLAEKLLTDYPAVKMDGEPVSSADKLTSILQEKLPDHLEEIAKLGLLKA